MKILLVSKNGKESEANVHAEDVEEIHRYYHISGKHFKQISYKRQEEFKNDRRIYKEV